MAGVFVHLGVGGCEIVEWCLDGCERMPWCVQEWVHRGGKLRDGMVMVVVHGHCARKPVLLCDELLSIRCKPNLTLQE